MIDDCRHIEKVLATATHEEKIVVLKSMQRRISDGEPAAFFDLARKHVGDNNNEIRWQTMIVLGEYIPSGCRNKDIWDVILQYCGIDDDMQDALATILLEHLLEYDFDCTIERIKASSSGGGGDALLDLLKRCWRFGQAQSEWDRLTQIIATLRR